MAHVLDHSNHHQVYTDFKFIGKCNYIKLPPQDLWDNTSLQNNSLLFLALQSLADGKPLPQLLSVFSVLRLTYPIPYTCKSLFTIQPQIPQYNGSQRLRKAYNVARGLARYNLQRTQRSHMYIYIYLYTLHDFGHARHLGTNLTFTMNSRRSKNEIATTSASILPSNKATQQKWPFSARNVYAVWVWLPHILTPVGRTKEVRAYCAISSVISAVRCRWRMFLFRPLNLQGAGNSYPSQPHFRGEKSRKYGWFGWMLHWRPSCSTNSAVALYLVAYSCTLWKILYAPNSYKSIHLRHVLWNMLSANYLAW